MRVAAHNGADILGGQEIWTIRLLDGLRDRGHEVLLFVRDDRMRCLVEDRGVPARVSRIGGHVMLPHAFRFARDLRAWSPDALILTTFRKSWLGSMGARLASVPRVFGRIGLSTDLPSRRWTYRVAYSRGIDRTAVNADGTRVRFLEELPDVTGDRVVTIYDGVPELERSREPGAVRGELDIPRDAPVIGTVTRLAEQKRLDRLLEMVAVLPPRVHCVIAGEGDLEDDLRARSRALEVDPRVRFLGFRDDVGDILAALDLYVVTSDKEGMSNSMLEALAAGVPVVSTPVSGASEALDPLSDGRRPGWVVGRTVEELARAVGRALEDRCELDEAGREARRRWKSRFSFDSMVDAWETMLSGAPGASVHQGPSPLEPRLP